MARRRPQPSTPTTSAGRVLQLPGQEFGAFRWGYTVDPPLPGLTDRPLVTRDLLPLGSAAAMDLLYALDDRFQTGTVDPAAIAPVARLLGADTIWVTGDAAFDRFRTARPEVVDDLFAAGVPGIGDRCLRRAGRQRARRPDGRRAVAVRSPHRTARSRPSRWCPSPIAGRGAGQGRRRARRRQRGRARRRRRRRAARRPRARALHGLARRTDELRGRRRRRASEVIVTDTNRERAHHWRSSQDVVGFTEDGDPAHARRAGRGRRRRAAAGVR